jgi:large subunit ribosomal protein L25
MEKTTLTAEKRTITGKKVKKLRKDGMVPANLFGKNVKSLSLQIPIKDFLTVYKKAGETGLVELKVDKETYHTLISKLQTHPLTRLPVHAEFHAVSLTEKIKAKVPVELIGESPAVRDGLGNLLQTLNEVEVEALPTDLPEKMEIDISQLSAVDQQLVVADFTQIKGVELLNGKDEVVAKIAKIVVEAEVPPPVTEAPAEGDLGQAPEPGTEKTETPSPETPAS